MPPPTWCPRCRNVRRLTWREFHTLYKDTCKLCGKNIISTYAPDGPFTIYCRECWRSDKWSPLDYGRDYDFSKPFFKQFRELLEAVPRPALTGTNLVNCDYSHACQNCKNCYFCFWSYFSQDSQYAYGLLLSRDCYDAYIANNSDHVYEAMDVDRMFRSRFTYFSEDCLDSSFLYDCIGCSDCFGGVNLRKKKYCLFNEQLSKEEYAARVKEWDLGSYAKLQEAKSKFYDLYLSLPRKYAHIVNAVGSTGDVIRDTKNCKNCFTVLDNVENCKYMYGAGLNVKDSMDGTSIGDLAALIYESTSTTRSERVFFSGGCGNANDVQYCDFVDFSKLFGCVAIKKKQYCILNKQYPKAEYEGMAKKVRQHMDEMPYVDSKGREYRYGEFFPQEIAVYAYNESHAFLWYPRAKEEVLAEGLRWRDAPVRDYEITKEAKDLPDHIRDADDGLLQDIIGCAHKGNCSHQCTTAFRLNSQELGFYRNMNVALPRLCPQCRFHERFAWRNRFDLWHRRCMCAGLDSTSGDRRYTNSSSHFHGSNPCPNEFETTTAPERPEIIYCDQCFKSEFL